jgi:hypothetical protein
MLDIDAGVRHSPVCRRLSDMHTERHVAAASGPRNSAAYNISNYCNTDAVITRIYYARII